jgi:ketosteroid isomerase-like protein
MKHIAVFFMLAAAVAASAQTKEKETQKRSTGATQALLDLENQWVDALTKSDTAKLDSIFVNGYVDTDEHNQRSDKQGVLALLKSGDLKIASIKLSDMRVYDYGDAAIVTGSAAQSGSFQGQPVTAKLIFTDTFIRQNGRWRAVASHRSAA